VTGVFFCYNIIYTHGQVKKLALHSFICLRLLVLSSLTDSLFPLSFSLL